MVKFFLEDPKVLVKETRLIPDRDHMTLEEQLNCLTRIILVIFIMMYLMAYDGAILFVLLALFLIIILYYINKQPSKEPYTEMNLQTGNLRGAIPGYKNPLITPQTTQLNDYSFPKLQSILEKQKMESTTDRTIKQKYTVKPLSNDNLHGESSFVKAIRTQKEILPNQLFRSKNQALVGGANPKTLIPPVVVPPSLDYTYWKDGNDFSIPQQINRRVAQDFYASGYYTDEPACNTRPRDPRSNQPTQAYGMYPNANPIINDFRSEPEPEPVERKPQKFTGNNQENNKDSFSNQDQGQEDSIEGYMQMNGRLSTSRVGGTYDQYEKTSSNLDQPYCKYTNIKYINDFVDNPTNIKYNLPVNYNSTPYQLQDDQKEYNEQLFMSDVNPDTYYKTRYIEPLSSNIGISYTQQIPQLEKETPLTYQEQTEKYGLGPQDVYDPRFTGYGTSYRQYNEKMTGQPRFDYSDVNSIRQPNFIARTNVDFLKDTMTYGPMLSAEDTVYCNDTMRERVEAAYLENEIGFRNEMMGKLLRPKNVQGWQHKTMPNHTRPQFTMGARKI